MKASTTITLATTLLALAVNAFAIDLKPICCDGGYEYRYRDRIEAQKAASDLKSRLAALERERQQLADQLAAAQKQNDALSTRVSDLERQLSDKDREITALQSGAGDASKLASQLSSAQGDLAQSQARAADLERQLASLQDSQAVLQASSGDKDRLAAELAAAQSQLAALQADSGDKDKLAAEAAALKQRIADLEKQLADRDKELADLRGDLSAEMAKLKEAQRGLIRALRPQINKGDITIDLNNERLLINLASGYLFGSGEDQLKPAGADALKQVGAILKDFPEYKVHVEGHTDNRPIRSSLKKKFPSNKELSEARAANAAQALANGGLPNAHAMGAADTKPVMPNTTDAGRAKNRRVEISVVR
ncbi:MAG: OmpA family protein [Nitrospirae bacterium]|nr:OmpA family protein [Nitrospirota bacterium]